MQLIHLAGLRYLQRHLWLTILAIVGVALGVAVVVSIDLANQSALKSFEQASSALQGRATHRISAGPMGVDEQLFRDLRIKLGLRTVAPVIEAYATSRDDAGVRFHVFGVDSLSEGEFRDLGSGFNSGDDFNEFLTEPLSALMNKTTAQRRGLNKGDKLWLNVNGAHVAVTIIGFIENAEHSQATWLEQLLVMDIASAQELFSFYGRLSRIELILPEGEERQALLSQIEAFLPDDVAFHEVDRNAGLTQLTSAFRTNLTAMSLLALLVGGFIIYNSIAFSVIQRRSLFASLRAIGVTGKEIAGSVLVEALVLAMIGTVFGLVLGVLLANGLLGLVGRTVSELYGGGGGQQLHVDSLLIIKGTLLGLGISLLAAFLPAREAMNTLPRLALQYSAAEEKTRAYLSYWAAVGVGSMLAALLLILLSGKSLVLSFVALFLWVIGYVLIAPQLIAWIAKRLHSVLGRLFGLLGGMVVQGIHRSLSRSKIALAALVIAVATTLGVTMMIDSFRSAVTDWIGHSLQANVYVSVPGHNKQIKFSALDTHLVQQLKKMALVRTTSEGRRAWIESEYGEVEVLAINVPREGFMSFHVLQGDIEQAWQDFQHSDSVMISESFAYRHQLNVGDGITLSGGHHMKVSAVFRDYATEQGKLVMQRDRYARYWQDDGIDTLGLYAVSDHDEMPLMREVEALLPGHQAVSVSSRTSIQENTISVFDRTFAITDVLRLLTLIVAIVGILSAPMALQLERAREFALLRSTGMTIKQVWTLVIAETGLMGGLAGVLAIPLGLSISMMLIYVINRRSFGWSMEPLLDPLQLLSAVLLAVIAALAAAIYPAYRMSKTSPALVLRGE